MSFDGDGNWVDEYPSQWFYYVSVVLFVSIIGLNLVMFVIASKWYSLASAAFILFLLWNLVRMNRKARMRTEDHNHRMRELVEKTNETRRRYQ